ncbi:MAG: DUF1592 domain-containing protein [Polyangiaceae bacterium]|nr:DUF1592 domain-containing protein [Polyangiaceae bacterium]
MVTRTIFWTFWSLTAAMGGIGCSATAERAGARNDPGDVSLPDPGASSEPPGSGPAAPGPGTPDIPPISESSVGPTVLRRLTNTEYRNTVKALLQLPTAPEAPLQPESWSHGFDNFAAALNVSPAIAAQYADIAKKHAADFVVPACAAPSLEIDCARSFIASFGKQAFRRPLTAVEQEQYEALYISEHSVRGYASGLGQVVETFLQSPHLLYRTELGDPNAGVMRELTPYEVASELSYLLTSSMPDATLMATADANALRTPLEIEQQARRLIAMPAARDSVRHFLEAFVGVARWEQVVKNTTVYPAFTDSFSAAMKKETEHFLDKVLWEGDGTFSTLMAAPYSVVTAELAAFYGIRDQGQGPSFVTQELKAKERAGLLTHASVLSAHSHLDESFPIARGKFVRVGLLCQTLPAPPVNVVIQRPDPDPTQTTRERFQAHSSDPGCSGCHALIDPVGFGLENYDGMGRYRTEENGKPVDATGSITGTLDMNGPFSGGVELAAKVASSLEAKQCLALNAHRYTFGREETAAEGAATRNVASGLANGGMDVRELLIALTRSDAFRLRTHR